MTFRERYQKEETWHGKAMIMEIYHLAGSHREKRWTLEKTASYFCVSLGLVSENLKLAQALHTNSTLLQCNSRQDALNRLNGVRYGGRDYGSDS